MAGTTALREIIFMYVRIFGELHGNVFTLLIVNTKEHYKSHQYV